MKKYLFLILLTIPTAQVSDNTYTSAEASAMAGAIVAERGNDWSIFHNPAGLTEIDKSHFAVGGGKLYGYNWLQFYHLNAIISIPIFGNTGFSLQQLETKYKDNRLAVEQTFSIAHAVELQHDKNSHLAIGLTANFINWDLANSAGISGDGSDGLDLNSINSATLDLGIIASLREKYHFGAFLKNINSGAIGRGMTRQVLPRRINIGITYMPITGLTTSIVSEHLFGRDENQIKGAIKYKLNSYLRIYSGAQSNPNRFGLGFTFILNRQSISYGLITHPVMPITHQFNIGITM